MHVLGVCRLQQSYDIYKVDYTMEHSKLSNNVVVSEL